jgi:hypothetical protein
MSSVLAVQPKYGAIYDVEKDDGNNYVVAKGYVPVVKHDDDDDDESIYVIAEQTIMKRCKSQQKSSSRRYYNRRSCCCICSSICGCITLIKGRKTNYG